MLWFNPPFNGEVSTNITRLFLNTIAKHFQKGTKLGKLFNKNNIKVSYSCTPNIKSIIDSHNRKVLQGKKDTSNQKLCNCQKSRKADCVEVARPAGSATLINCSNVQIITFSGYVNFSPNCAQYYKSIQFIVVGLTAK